MLELADTVFESLDQLLTEMRPLRQLLLDVAMDLHISSQRLDFLLHFVIFEEKLFALLRLIFQLRR